MALRMLLLAAQVGKFFCSHGGDRGLDGRQGGAIYEPKGGKMVLTKIEVVK